MMRNPFRHLLALVTALSLVQTATAREMFYVLIFSGQVTPNLPDESHTWATFVRAEWDDNTPSAEPRLQAVTISWLPTSMVVRSLAPRPECGRNFDLETTLQWCMDRQIRMTVWGAYAIDPELFYRAQAQIERLNSEQVRYKAADLLRNHARVTNCTHAVSALADGPRLLPVFPGWGDPASRAVIRRLRPWMLELSCPEPWVATTLGLDAYPIRHAR